MPHDLNTLRTLAARTRVQTNGTHARATLTLPNGRTVQCVIRCDTPQALEGELEALAGQGLAGGDEELAGFMDKLKTAAKKTGKIALKPLQLAHKVTHKGPIGKLEAKLQDMVGKALPFTKPLIELHKKISNPIHKAIETGKIKKQATAKAIVEITKGIPDVAARAGAQAALVASVRQKEALKTIAKTAVKAKVLSEAAKAAKQGDVEAKQFLSRAKAAAASVPKRAAPPKRATPTTSKRAAVVSQAGVYEVRTPSGRIIKIPASKVA